MDWWSVSPDLYSVNCRWVAIPFLSIGVFFNGKKKKTGTGLYQGGWGVKKYFVGLEVSVPGRYRKRYRTQREEAKAELWLSQTVLWRYLEKRKKFFFIWTVKF